MVAHLRFVPTNNKPSDKTSHQADEPLLSVQPKVGLWEILLVVLVFVVVAGLGYNWIASDAVPPLEHSGRSIQDSVVLWERFNEDAGFGPGSYPPLAYLVSVVFYNCFGVSRVVAIGSQLFFLLPYLFSAWWIGRQLGGRWGGMLALLACAGNPWMSFHLHGYFLEVAVTALVAVALAFLVASQGCRKIGPTMWLGLALGLGMLSKWSFAFFVGPLLLWPLVVAWKENHSSRWLSLGGLAALSITLAALKVALGSSFWGFPWKAYLLALDSWLLLAGAALYFWSRRGYNSGVGLASALATAFVTCGWWYFLSLQELQLKAAGDLTQHFSEAQAFWTLLGTLSTCGWIAPVWFLAGLVYCWNKRSQRTIMLALGASIVSALVIYMLSHVPAGPRYILPGTFGLLVAAFAWLGNINWVKQVSTAALVAVCGIQLCGYMAVDTVWTKGSEGIRPDDYSFFLVHRLEAPDTQLLPISETTKRILEELSVTGEYRITGIILPKSRVDADMFMLESIIQGQLIDIEHYLPGRTTTEPRTSLVLVIGEDEAEFHKEVPWLSTHKFLKMWGAPGWGKWALYQHPTRRDDRPSPGVTDGPPRPF